MVGQDPKSYIKWTANVCLENIVGKSSMDDSPRSIYKSFDSIPHDCSGNSDPCCLLQASTHLPCRFAQYPVLIHVWYLDVCFMKKLFWFTLFGLLHANTDLFLLLYIFTTETDRKQLNKQTNIWLFCAVMVDILWWISKR